jgi:hypothetical protein
MGEGTVQVRTVLDEAAGLPRRGRGRLVGNALSCRSFPCAGLQIPQRGQGVEILEFQENWKRTLTREVILGLDIAEESRTLSDEERRLRNELKFRCLGLASLNRTIIRQRSKLLYLAEGDANTKKNSFASLPSEKGKMQ